MSSLCWLLFCCRMFEIDEELNGKFASEAIVEELGDEP